MRLRSDLNILNRITFAIIAFVGAIVSIKLLLVYFNANFNPQATPSFCAINEYLDCDAVAETAYSRFLSIPLSLWGLGFYLFILFISLFPFHKYKFFEGVDHPKAIIFTLSCLSILVSVILLFISTYIIEKVCLLCHLLYLTNITIFVAAKLGSSFTKLFKNTFNDIKNIIKNRQLVKTVSVLAICGIATLVAINIFKPFTPEGTMLESGPGNYYTMGEIGNVLGDKDARLVIREYTDYECPYCSISNEMMLRLSKEVDGIRIEHHDFPLDKQCNPFINASLHKNSCLAIYYAKAARMQGKFWDMATLLYNNREHLNRKNILKLAKTIDLDIDKLERDIEKNKSRFKKEIRKDIEKARSLGINGTPSYTIGIKKYEGIMPYRELKAKVRENL